MKLNISEAHRLVRQQRARGNDVFWNGWDEIVFFNPNPKAMFSVKGMFRNGKWGYANRFMCGSDGTWSIDQRNVR
jgi:hypothetical protein